ncbi:Type I secretion system membrane fusion protein PrsE [compost metagenome]
MSLLHTVPGRDPLRMPTRTLRAAVLALTGGFVGAIAWSNVATIDVSATANGRIVPSRQIQLVQNLEGGIVSALLVKEGATVKKGQVLARIQSTEFSASLGEIQSSMAAFKSEIARLTAETEDAPLRFPAELEKAHPDLVAKQTKLFESRRQGLADTIDALRQDVVHARNEGARASQSLPLLRSNLAIARQQLAIIEPQVAKGLLSELELLNAKQRILEAQGKINEASHSLPAASSLAAGAEGRIREERQKFRSLALAQLAEDKVKLDGLEQQLRTHTDRLSRREVRSPVNGVVKKLRMNTIGEVVRPGESILEIVPSEDTLIVEAKVSPKDIAFVHAGQTAHIRVTAYDASIYGALPAVVEQVSADATVGERDEVYYMVRVRATSGFQGADLPLRPGMVSQVDVITGRRTVFDYVVKPLTKLQYTAMHER